MNDWFVFYKNFFEKLIEIDLLLLHIHSKLSFLRDTCLFWKHSRPFRCKKVFNLAILFLDHRLIITCNWERWLLNILTNINLNLRKFKLAHAITAAAWLFTRRASGPLSLLLRYLIMILFHIRDDRLSKCDTLEAFAGLVNFNDRLRHEIVKCSVFNMDMNAHLIFVQLESLNLLS